MEAVMRTLMVTFAALMASSLLATSPTWADFDDAMDAFDRGDYETAIKELRPLAEQGDADAQTHRITSYNVCYTKLLRTWLGIFL